MAAITGSIEIEREVAEVFSYSSDPAHRDEWQAAVEDVTVETPGATGVGTTVSETRHVTGGPRPIRWSYTHFDPSKLWSFRGVAGPVRPVGSMTFSPRDPGGTRVDMEIDFTGHGLGHLLVPLARRDARKQVPRDLVDLKRQLERAPAPD